MIIFCFWVITRDRRLRLKPSLVQDTDYMDPIGAYLMPQLPIKGSKGVSIYQNDR